ncbi:hypothetical protein Zmor_016458 [Zophobas morio]|uniref:Calponin-homology (CH) domain-containing protein n=2 Tax=Zophobas morio TaxID=2755281 RepID=A0AA38M1J6_9CUCU|nr:hypothetical protein Zmor_016458 [Zophobas morio]
MLGYLYITGCEALQFSAYLFLLRLKGMSNVVPPLGELDRAIAEKINSKYNPELEREVIDWIEQLTGLRSPGTKDQFQEFLRDGQVLCKLMNRLVPGAIPKINDSKLAFKQMENIENFLKACTNELNVPPRDLFQTVDLYENKNMVQVIDTIHAVGRHAKAKNYNGPTIGGKLAERNIRNFDEATYNAGKNIPSQQMGSNKNASQAGNTPYGAKREIDLLSHHKLR